VGVTKRGKGTKIMAIADRHGLPVAICTESATPHEVTLVEKTIDHTFVDADIGKLIGDKAYDSDQLDRRLAENRAIELIAPNRGYVRPHRPPQDGRPLRRYKRRWKIERLFAWLYNFRRLITRFEYHPENFLGFVRLGCAMILLRYL
jgi:transposase